MKDISSVFIALIIVGIAIYRTYEGAPAFETFFLCAFFGVIMTAVFSLFVKTESQKEKKK